MKTYNSLDLTAIFCGEELTLSLLGWGVKLNKSDTFIRNRLNEDKDNMQEIVDEAEKNNYDCRSSGERCMTLPMKNALNNFLYKRKPTSGGSLA